MKCNQFMTCKTFTDGYTLPLEERKVELSGKTKKLNTFYITTCADLRSRHWLSLK